MPEAKIYGPYKLKEDFDEEKYIRESVEETRVYLQKRLDEAYSISNSVFQTVCMFAVIDCLAQEYANYPTKNAQNVFNDFVLQFQSRYDFLEMVEPVTLFYDYEPNIKKIIKHEELHRLYPKEFPPELEVDIKDLGLFFDSTTIDEVMKKNISEEILSIIERQEGSKIKERYRERHKFISLLYKMRSKAVHELSSLGSEIKFDKDDCKKLPYYRFAGRMYEKDGFVVSDNIYELVIPNEFIYDLALNCIDNYLEYCINQKRLPFKNNSNFSRKVCLAWTDN